MERVLERISENEGTIVSGLTIEQVNAGSDFCNTLIRLSLTTKSSEIRMFFISQQIFFLLK
jgi:hypothetical protein